MNFPMKNVDEIDAAISGMKEEFDVKFCWVFLFQMAQLEGDVGSGCHGYLSRRE